jgi:putative oxidoreductase
MIALAQWSCRLVLGLTFAVAAALKILDPAAFATDIGHFHLLPHPLALGAAVYLPWLELLCGFAVLVRWRERGAQLVLAGLCGVFCVALASAWFRGLDLSCGCFGHGTDPSPLPLAIARSVALGLAALYLLGTGAKSVGNR